MKKKIDAIVQGHTSLLISRFKRIFALSFMFNVVHFVLLSYYVRYGSNLVNEVRFVYNLILYQPFSSVFS